MILDLKERDNMEVAYIAGPYRAETVYGILRNIRHAERYALKYWLKGYAVICPHKNTALFDGAADDRVWLDGDLEILARCDTIIMIEGWEHSSGARAELKRAQELGLKVIFDPGEAVEQSYKKPYYKSTLITVIDVREDKSVICRCKDGSKGKFSTFMFPYNPCVGEHFLWHCWNDPERGERNKIETIIGPLKEISIAEKCIT